MSTAIAEAEKLKQQLTGKFVVVASGVPELRRFAGLTGVVKTVNMNCRALVQFDGPADIAWYDISPTYLTVVDAPVKKQPKKEPAKPDAKSKAAAPKAGKAGKKGLSPLELARQQGAGGGAAKPAAKPAGKKAAGLSPLELARQQGAAGAKPAAKSPAKPASEGKTAPAGKKLSPLELARQQGAAKSGSDEETPVAEAPAPAPEAAEPAPALEKKKPAATTGPDGKPLSPLELARQQGAFKG